jgi:DNA invertase Pin-like site-specific DNA recombinase
MSKGVAVYQRVSTTEQTVEYQQRELEAMALPLMMSKILAL